ncbi:MAG: DUF4293 domain-containing protein [Alistipes sp.]|jgi:hypothetical protein|nr:DUF4293 domain-containing protein [Alistipes sp.]
MIQRIQSLYLLIVTLLMSLTLFMPIATFGVAGETFELTAFTLRCGDASQSTIWLGIMLILATLLPLVTIFLFKRRTLQIRLCAVEIVLLLGSLIMIGLYYWLTSRIFEGFEVEHRQFGWAAPMPIVSLVLAYLASRAIFKDEVLVRSLDRIR